MRQVVGNKQREITKEELINLVKDFSTVELDLGTGDGRFVYKKALSNPKVFYIGVDPSEKQLQIYSREAVRKKLNNVLFVVGSIEKLPSELEGVMNKIYINLPWGTLLEFVVKTTKEGILRLSKLLKDKGDIEVVFGYAFEFEPSETERLQLPLIGNELIKDSIIPVFESCGFKSEGYSKLGKEKLKDIETTWAKKLKFGKDRDIYKMLFSRSL
jgi:16S rRNA (adenine(1408)-N(1))-methyltransferase